jgi:hypothetical protein
MNSRCHPAWLVLVSVIALLSDACSGGSSPRPRGGTGTPPATSFLSVAYTTESRVTVTRPGKPNLHHDNPVDADSPQQHSTPRAFFWSADGRKVSWSSAGASVLVVADLGSGQVSSVPCLCTSGAFVGSDLVALNPEGTSLLVLRPGSAAVARVPVTGPLAKLHPSSVSVMGSDATGVLVNAETGSRGWHLFQVRLTGESELVTDDIPRRWMGAVRPSRTGSYAFSLSTNGGACGVNDQMAVVDTAGRSARVVEFPPTPTRLTVLDVTWGADGLLYAATGFWPVCDQNEHERKEQGRIWRIEGTTAHDTGLSLLSFQPVSADAYVGLRGTVPMGTGGGGDDRSNSLVVTKGNGLPARVAADVLTFEVSPSSIAPFTGPSRFLPPPPSSTPRPEPVLGH